jgi:hypothetical protein
VSYAALTSLCPVRSPAYAINCEGGDVPMRIGVNLWTFYVREEPLVDFCLSPTWYAGTMVDLSAGQPFCLVTLEWQFLRAKWCPTAFFSAIAGPARERIV